MEMTMTKKVIPAVGDKVFVRLPYTYNNNKGKKFKYESTDELVLLKKTIIGGYFDDDIKEEATVKDEKTGNIFTISSSNISLNQKDFPYVKIIGKTVIILIFLFLFLFFSLSIATIFTF